LYYVSVHQLAQKLCHFIRRDELLHPGDRVGVAVSGGPDSIALLRLLLRLRKELGIVLSVVHVNHKLRASESDRDRDFVCSLAREHKLELRSMEVNVAQHASQAGISLETSARELRYKFFRELLGEGSSSKPELDKVATGHTLDDQAETVLMRIIRGTGMRGLRSIQPRIEVQAEYGSGEIVRPLVGVRRSELQRYLADIGQSWREDATNRDLKFTRNRVRQLVLPLLEREFNPGIVEGLAELADIARVEEDFWENEAAGWMGTGIHWVEPQPRMPQLVQLAPAGGNPMPHQADRAQERRNALLDLAWLVSEHLAVQRRIVRAIADQAGFALDAQHVEEILRLASGQRSAGKELALPGGWKLTYGEDALEFVAPEATVTRAKQDYELHLTIPGEVTVPHTGSRLQAIQVRPGGLPADCDSDHLFDPIFLVGELTVRNWRPGDRYWPAHAKGPKKIKELLQERHVPQAQRSLWPVVLSGGEVIWVRGFPGRAHMRPREGKGAVLIREVIASPEKGSEAAGDPPL
jgi:tRNA(Ile)-lysidine synthase